MSVRVTTKEFIGLLAALVHTASDDPEMGAIAGILLHTARGYASAEPGRSTLLVGTSTDTITAGHTWVLANGHMQPMLWPIGQVAPALAVLRRMSKGDSDHTVEIRQDGDQVTLAEGENLFGEGASYTFDLGDASRFPRTLWRLLSDVHLRPAVRDRDADQVIPVGVRTDVSEVALAPFLTIAKARKQPIELYRYHQRLPVQVVIGGNYRGAFLPYLNGDDLDTSRHPDDAVYPADLPEPAPEPKPGGATSTVNLREATGLLLASVTDIADAALDREAPAQD
jgi:S-DNA-T family DNA segregation ATPase FtsK/SpoIIIE